METTQTRPTSPKAEEQPKTSNQPKVEEPKEEKPKEKVSAESVALTTAKAEFIKVLRTAGTNFKKAVDAELEKVEPGHPDYGNLKFAKIRAERVIFNADELSRGKINR